jgi:hypothetical protein
MLTPKELKKEKHEAIEKMKKDSDSWCIQFIKEQKLKEEQDKSFKKLNFFLNKINSL